MLTDRIAQALALAVEAHQGQKRKGTDIPYIAHPLGVASIALEHGADEELTMAALLHDAVEDGGPEYAQRIRQQFGDRVADIVEGCTDGMPDATGKKEDWNIRKERYVTHLEDACDDVLLVSGSDKLHNARAIVEDLLRIGPKVFERFTATPAQTLWYYETLAGIFDRRGTPMAKTLSDTVQRMRQLSGLPTTQVEVIERHCGTFVLRQGIEQMAEKDRQKLFAELKELGLLPVIWADHQIAWMPAAIEGAGMQNPMTCSTTARLYNCG